MEFDKIVNVANKQVLQVYLVCQWNLIIGYFLAFGNFCFEFYQKIFIPLKVWYLYLRILKPLIFVFFLIL